MNRDNPFGRPRSLARALAELARRTGGAHAAEAELRAALPAAMGSWLHSRLGDVRLAGTACTLVMTDDAGEREARALLPEIERELRRRLGPVAPGKLLIARQPQAPRQPSRAPAPPRNPGPLTRQVLDEIPEEGLRRRLATWAGVSIDPERTRDP